MFKIKCNRHFKIEEKIFLLFGRKKIFFNSNKKKNMNLIF